MVDITHKTNTLRIATAQAVVQVSKPETIAAIQERRAVSYTHLDVYTRQLRYCAPRESRM